MSFGTESTYNSRSELYPIYILESHMILVGTEKKVSRIYEGCIQQNAVKRKF